MTTKVEAINSQITLGDLVVAITDRARRVTANDRDAYHLVRFLLNRMLRPVPEPATDRPTKLALRNVNTLDCKYL